MRPSYDSEANCAYLPVSPGESARQEEVTTEAGTIILDLDAQGRLLGVELTTLRLLTSEGLEALVASGEELFGGAKRSRESHGGLHRDSLPRPLELAVELAAHAGEAAGRLARRAVDKLRGRRGELSSALAAPGCREPLEAEEVPEESGQALAGEKALKPSLLEDLAEAVSQGGVSSESTVYNWAEAEDHDSFMKPAPPAESTQPAAGELRGGGEKSREEPSEAPEAASSTVGSTESGEPGERGEAAEGEALEPELAVPCPSCPAAEGEECRTPSGKQALRTHKARLGKSALASS